LARAVVRVVPAITVRNDVAMMNAIIDDVAMMGAIIDDVAMMGAIIDDVAMMGAIIDDVAMMGAIRGDNCRGDRPVSTTIYVDERFRERDVA
jgi:hypothetical protein